MTQYTSTHQNKCQTQSSLFTLQWMNESNVKWWINGMSIWRINLYLKIILIRTNISSYLIRHEIFKQLYSLWFNSCKKNYHMNVLREEL